MAGEARKTLDGDDLFSEVIQISGQFNFSLFNNSSFNGTVTLQRRFATTDPWGDVAQFTDVFENRDVQPNGAFFRFGIKTGDYTSGSIDGRLGV